MDSPDFLPVVEDFGLDNNFDNSFDNSFEDALETMDMSPSDLPEGGVAVNDASDYVAVNIPPPLLQSTAALHAEALRLTADAHLLAQKTEQDLTRDLVTRTAIAQNALFRHLQATMHVVIPETARTGACHATLLTFVGAEVYPGAATVFINDDPDPDQKPEPALCYLHLLKGPKDHVRRRELVAHGFEPLLVRLRREFSPFRIQHHWDQTTNANHILVGW